MDTGHHYSVFIQCNRFGSVGLANSLKTNYVSIESHSSLPGSTLEQLSRLTVWVMLPDQMAEVTPGFPSSSGIL